MSDLAKRLKGDDPAPNSTRLASILAGVERYGKGSEAQLRKMATEVGNGAYGVVEPYLPERQTAENIAEMVSPMLAGHSTMRAMRDAGEAGRAFREGDYLTGADKSADAVLHQIEELLFFIPGHGYARAFKP